MAMDGTTVRRHLEQIAIKVTKISEYAKLEFPQFERALNCERQIAQKLEQQGTLTTRRREIEEGLMKKYSRTTYPGVDYGSDEWFSKLIARESGAQSDRGEREKLIADIAKLDEEMVALRKSILYSIDLLQTLMDQAHHNIRMALGAYQLIERDADEKVRAKLAGVFVQVKDIAGVLEEIHTVLLQIRLTFDKGGTVRDAWEAVREFLGLLQLDGELIDDAKKVLAGVEISIPETNVYHAYTILCTDSARHWLKNENYLLLFRKRFDSIVNMYGPAKSDPTDKWSYIQPSDVVRGRITKGIRIVYDITDDGHGVRQIRIYEFGPHGQYDDVLTALKAGTYVKKPMSPLMSFYAFEAA